MGSDQDRLQEGLISSPAIDLTVSENKEENTQTMKPNRQFMQRQVQILLILLALTTVASAADISGSLYLDNFQFSPAPAATDPAESTPAEDTPTNESFRPVLIESEESPSNRLTLKMFPSNLGHNFIGLFNSRNLRPFIAGMAISGISSQLDDSVGGYFGSRNVDTLFSETGAQAGKPYVVAPAVAALFLTGLHSDNEKFKSFSYALAQGYVLNLGITQGLKATTGRERPDGSNSKSFPSGHSADAFMIATVVHQFYGNKAGIAAYGAAALVASSRVKSNVHWLSDVAAGATIGYIIGRTVSRNAGGLRLFDHVTVEPSIQPFQKQYGANFTIHLP